jgi:hypothetical protein
MKFPDISNIPVPITGFKIEVDHWALGYYIFQELQEKFGPEQILQFDPRSFPGEYSIHITAKEKTPEIEEFSKKLAEDLQEKGISVYIWLRLEKTEVKSKPVE